MTARVSRADAVRLLRQRMEMGEVELFFDGLDRHEVLRLAAAALEQPVATAEVSEDAPSPRREEEPTLAMPKRPQAAPPRPDDRPAAPRGAKADPATDKAASPGAGPDLPVLPGSYEDLRSHALGCTSCRLAEGRTQVVFSDGPPDARLMVVGEAPGANEDEQGLPFIGAAGRFLDLLLATVDLSRQESVYICNVVKCRPPGNRNPMPDEIAACAPYLRKQIELVAPEAILAVGSFAAQLLTGREKSALGKIRGEVHAYEGVPLVVTYHPAALLRNANWTRAFWDDLQLLRGVMDEDG